MADCNIPSLPPVTPLADNQKRKRRAWLVQWDSQERQRQETAPGFYSVANVSAPHTPPLHHCALHGSAKKRGSTIKRLRFAGGSGSGNRTEHRPGNGSRCGRLRRLVVWRFCNITASYAKRVRRLNLPPFRVRIRGRYVLRPSGKYRHKVSVHPLR